MFIYLIIAVDLSFKPLEMMFLFGFVLGFEFMDGGDVVVVGLGLGSSGGGLDVREMDVFLS